MIARGMSAEEVAAKFRKSKAWIYENWEGLVKEGRIPRPLLEAGHLVWDRAQLNAYLDRDVPAKLRPLVAAHRAAEEAATNAPVDYVAGDAIERHRGELDRRLARSGGER